MIAGATSIHGWSLYQAAKERSIVPVCNTHVKGGFCRDWNRMDTENTQGWVDLLESINPSTLVYCAGVCNVDQCRKHPEWARELNVNAIERLLQHLPSDVSLVYVSTDHVFSNHETPRVESDDPEPLSYYGELRAEAESLVLRMRPDALLVRPGLCLGPSADGRRGHWNSAQRRIKRDLQVTVIEGELRSAMWAPDAGRQVLQWIDEGVQGLHHLTADKSSSRIDVIKALCEVNQLPAIYEVTHRDELEYPHLGNVSLGSQYDHDPLPAFPDRIRDLFSPKKACCE